METYPEDELTLRDLYLILKRRARLIWSGAIGLALVAFAISALMPKTYESAAVFSVASSKGAKPAALVEAFKARLGTAGFAKQLGEGDRVTWAKVRYDEKKGYLRLTASAHDPETARARAVALAEAASEDFVADQLVSLKQELEKERADLRTTLLALTERQKVLEASLRALPKGIATPNAGEALRSMGVDPLVAESPDPAAAYLRLELAKVEADVAAKTGRLKQLEALLSDEAALRRLAEARSPLRLVASPGLPLEPVAPRPLLNTALAFVLGLFLAVFWAFLQAALEPPEETQVAEKPSAVSG